MGIFLKEKKKCVYVYLLHTYGMWRKVGVVSLNGTTGNGFNGEMMMMMMI